MLRLEFADREQNMLCILIREHLFYVQKPQHASSQAEFLSAINGLQQQSFNMVNYVLAYQDKML
jgi:hypothetical protein